MTDHYPAVIHAPDTVPNSVAHVRVHRDSLRTDGMWDRFGDNPALFKIFDGTLRAGHDVPGSLLVKHTFALDEEADRVNYAMLDLSDITFVHAYDNYMKFTGWLTGAKFYPEGEEDPFAGAVRKDDEDDYYANAGYPYLPESVPLPFAGPVKVEIDIYTLNHMTEDERREYPIGTRKDYAERRQERADKIRREAEAKAARDAERAHQRALAKEFMDNEPNGPELRALEAELAEAKGEVRREFLGAGKYDRLRELRGEFNEWAEGR